MEHRKDNFLELSIALKNIFKGKELADEAKLMSRFLSEMFPGEINTKKFIENCLSEESK